MFMNAMRIRAVSYREAVQSTLFQQILTLGLASMIMDGGTMLCICLYAAAGFWAGVALVRTRRATGTKADLLFIQGSYLPLCLVSFFIAGVSHHWEFLK